MRLDYQGKAEIFEEKFLSFTIVAKLESEGFSFRGAIVFGKKKISRAKRTGHVYVQEPKQNHPKFDEHHLPVGFIMVSGKARYSAELVNTDKKFFRGYHKQLRKLYSSA